MRAAGKTIPLVTRLHPLSKVCRTHVCIPSNVCIHGHTSVTPMPVPPSHVFIPCHTSVSPVTHLNLPRLYPHHISFYTSTSRHTSISPVTRLHPKSPVYIPCYTYLSPVRRLYPQSHVYIPCHAYLSLVTRLYPQSCVCISHALPPSHFCILCHTFVPLLHVNIPCHTSVSQVTSLYSRHTSVFPVTLLDPPSYVCIPCHTTISLLACHTSIPYNKSVSLSYV